MPDLKALLFVLQAGYADQAPSGIMNTLWHYELIVLVLQAGACPYIAKSMRLNRGSWLVVVMMP